MDSFLNQLISAHDKQEILFTGEHDPRRRRVKRSLRDAVSHAVDEYNSQAHPTRRVSHRSAHVAAERSLVASAGRPNDQRSYLALRAVNQLLSAAAGSSDTDDNTDLLPVGHPLSTAPSAMTASAVRDARAQWLAGDPRLDDEVRPLVAAAYAAPHGSVDRLYAFTRLSVTDGVPTDLAVDEQAPLVASMSWRGNSSAAKSARARAQRRDRLQRFAFMGGLFRFMGIDTETGRARPFLGQVVGEPDGAEVFELEVVNDPDLGTGIVTVTQANAESIKARLNETPEQAKVRLAGKVPTAKEAARAATFAELLATKKDAPTGWAKAKNTKNPTWVSDDGYTVTRRTNPDGSFQYTLSRNDGENDAVGTKVGTGKSWYDIQNLAEKDSVDYEAAEAAKTAKASTAKTPDPHKGSDQTDRPGWTYTSRVVDRPKSNLGKDMGQYVQGTWTSDDGEYVVTATPASLEVRRKGFGGGPMGYTGTWDDVDKVIAADRPKLEADKAKAAEAQGEAADKKAKQDAWEALSDDEREIITAGQKAAALLGEYDTADGQLAEAALAGDVARVEELLAQSEKYQAVAKLVDDSLFKDYKSIPEKNADKAMLNLAEARQLVKKVADLKAKAPAAAPLSPGDRFDAAKKNPAAAIAYALDGRNEPFYDPAIGDNAPAVAEAIDDLTAAIAEVAAPGSADDAVARLSRLATAYDNLAVAIAETVDYKPDTEEMDQVEQLTEFRDDLSDIAMSLGGEADAAPVTPTGTPDVDAMAKAGGYTEVTSDAERQYGTRSWEREDGDDMVEVITQDSDGTFSSQYYEKTYDQDMDEDRYDQVDGGYTQYGDDAASAFDFRGEQAPAAPAVAEVVAKQTAKDFAAENKVGLPALEKAFASYVEGYPAETWAQSDTPITSLVTAALRGDTEALDTLDRITENLSDLVGEGGTGNKKLVDTAYALGLLTDALRARPVPVQKTNSKSPVAAVPSGFDSWVVPEGTYAIRPLGSYTPAGRTFEDSADYTDDPEVLASKFTPDMLSEVLGAALMGGLPDTYLPFSSGEELVPVEAVAEAMYRQGADVDAFIGNMYDFALNNSTNFDNLKRFRDGSTDADASAPTEIDRLEDITPGNKLLSKVNMQIASQRAAAVTTELINRYAADGSANPKVKEIADFLKNQDKFGANRALAKFMAFAESDDPQENDAFRGLLGLLHISDGGGGSIDKILGDAYAIYREDFTADVTPLLQKYGTYADLVRSRARVAKGDEDPDSPDSIAGATYRLAAALSENIGQTTYRGLPVEKGSNALRDFTTEGNVISLDLRPTSDSTEVADSFAGLYFDNAGSETVMFVIPSGQSRGVDMRGISPFVNESEILGTGNYRIVGVTRTTTPDGRVINTVELASTDAEIALENKADTPNATVDMPEGRYTLETSPFDATGVDPELKPYSIAQSFSEADLKDALFEAVADGTGVANMRGGSGALSSAPAEAIRDALKIQGVDTDQYLQSVKDDIVSTGDEDTAMELELNDMLAGIGLEDTTSDWYAANDMVSWGFENESGDGVVEVTLDRESNRIDVVKYNADATDVVGQQSYQMTDMKKAFADVQEHLRSLGLADSGADADIDALAKAGKYVETTTDEERKRGERSWEYSENGELLEQIMQDSDGNFVSQFYDTFYDQDNEPRTEQQDGGYFEHGTDAAAAFGSKGDQAPPADEFVYTGKKAEPATAAQKQLVKDLLANDNVPDDVRDRIEADLAENDGTMNKGQIGEIIGRLREYPGSTAPTARQLNSVKRDLVARGVDEATAQDILDRLDTMTRDEVSKEIKKLKAMPDRAGQVAAEAGFVEISDESDQARGTRRWVRDDEFGFKADELELDADGFSLTNYYPDENGEPLSMWQDAGRDVEALAGMIAKPSPEASANASAALEELRQKLQAPDVSWTKEQTPDFIDQQKAVDSKVGFEAYATRTQTSGLDETTVTVYDDRGHQVGYEKLPTGTSIEDAKVQAEFALRGAVDKAVEAREANPAGFTQNRVLDDLLSLDEHASEIMFVLGSSSTDLPADQASALRDLSKLGDNLSKTHPGIMDRLENGTATQADGTAVAEAMATALSKLEGGSPIGDALSDKISQLTDSLEKMTAASAPEAAALDLPDGADLTGFKKLTDRLGSNEGGVYEGPDGQKYYVKTAKSQAHADSEVLASKLYRELGVNAVEVRRGTLDGKLVTFSPMIEGKSDLRDRLKNDPEFIKAVQEGFAIDAWLGNWDVAGLDFDNILSTPDGQPLRVDTGGALEWRAQGQPKTSVSDGFTQEATETGTLLDPVVNPQSARLFGGMSEEELAEAASKLGAIDERTIDSIVEEAWAGTKSQDEIDKMKLVLKTRRADILTKLMGEPDSYDFMPEGAMTREVTPAEFKQAIESVFDPSEVVANEDTNWTNPQYGKGETIGVDVYINDELPESRKEEIRRTLDNMYNREHFYFEALDRAGENEGEPLDGMGLLDKVILNGGATVSPLTDQEPTTGFAVSVQGFNKEIPADVFFDPDKGPEAIADWYESLLDQFEENSAYHVGLWYDKKNQEVVLDITEVFTPDQRDAAIEAGKARNQQAIWDLTNQEPINTGGTGDRAGEEPTDTSSVSAEGPGRPATDSRGDSGLGQEDSQPSAGEGKADGVVPKLDIETTRNADGVHFPAQPLSTAQVQALRDGTVAPPALPFVVRKTSSGDVHYYDSTGTRRWGQFGAAGMLVTRSNPETGADEFMLVQRADGLSTEPGKWTVPGGAHVSKGEAAREHRTAEKELQEETELILDDNGLRKTVKVQPAPDWAFDYTVAPTSNDWDIRNLGLDPAELQDAKWVSAEEFKQMQADGQLHSAMDADTVDKLVEAGSTPFGDTPVRKPKNKAGARGFAPTGSKARRVFTPSAPGAPTRSQTWTKTEDGKWTDDATGQKLDELPEDVDPMSQGIGKGYTAPIEIITPEEAKKGKRFKYVGDGKDLIFTPMSTSTPEKPSAPKAPAKRVFDMGLTPAKDLVPGDSLVNGNGEKSVVTAVSKPDKNGQVTVKFTRENGTDDELKVGESTLLSAELAPAAPAGPPTPPNKNGGGTTPPDGPDGPDDDNLLPGVDPDMPDVEPTTAEIAPGDIVSMQRIKAMWPDHVVLDNGDVVVSSYETTRDGRKVRREVVIKRNAVTGNNETYTVYGREVDLETGETRILSYKNRSHSDKALRNQVAKMNGRLRAPSANARFKKTKPNADAAKPKVLRDISDPEVQSAIEAALAEAPNRSDEENLDALIGIADMLQDNEANRESMAERMKDWVSYFGSGEAVRAVFDAVQAGDAKRLGKPRKVTHLSQNGVQLTPGMRVRWTSPDGKKVRYGTVTRLENLASKGYGYTDYAYVRFDDAPKGRSPVHRVSDRLVALDGDDNPLASPDGAKGAPSGAAPEATPAATEGKTPIDVASLPEVPSVGAYQAFNSEYDGVPTDEMLEAVEAYADQRQVTLEANELLREAKGEPIDFDAHPNLTPGVEAFVQELTDLTMGSVLQNDAVVFRGRTVRNQENWDVIENLREGDLFVDHGFMSASTSETVAERFRDMFGDDPSIVPAGRVMFRIKMAKGQSGFELPPNMGYSNEYEVILPPGTALRVNGLFQDNGLLFVDAEVVSQDAPVAKSTPEVELETDFDEIGDIISEATEVIDVPQDEEPTVAELLDGVLKDEPVEPEAVDYGPPDFSDSPEQLARAAKLDDRTPGAVYIEELMNSEREPNPAADAFLEFMQQPDADGPIALLQFAANMYQDYLSVSQGKWTVEQRDEVIRGIVGLAEHSAGGQLSGKVGGYLTKIGWGEQRINQFKDLYVKADAYTESRFNVLLGDEDPRDPSSLIGDVYRMIARLAKPTARGTWRGVGFYRKEKAAKYLTVGNVVAFDGVSSSRSKIQAEEFASGEDYDNEHQVMLYFPAGSNGLDAEPFTMYQGEEEVLMSGLYEVAAVDLQEDGETSRYNVQLRQVKAPAAAPEVSDEQAARIAKGAAMREQLSAVQQSSVGAPAVTPTASELLSALTDKLATNTNNKLELLQQLFDNYGVEPNDDYTNLSELRDAINQHISDNMGEPLVDPLGLPYSPAVGVSRAKLAEITTDFEGKPQLNAYGPDGFEAVEASPENPLAMQVGMLYKNENSWDTSWFQVLEVQHTSGSTPDKYVSVKIRRLNSNGQVEQTLMPATLKSGFKALIPSDATLGGGKYLSQVTVEKYDLETETSTHDGMTFDDPHQLLALAPQLSSKKYADALLLDNPSKVHSTLRYMYPADSGNTGTAYPIHPGAVVVRTDGSVGVVTQIDAAPNWQSMTAVYTDPEEPATVQWLSGASAGMTEVRAANTLTSAGGRTFLDKGFPVYQLGVDTMTEELSVILHNLRQEGVKRLEAKALAEKEKAEQAAALLAQQLLQGPGVEVQADPSAPADFTQSPVEGVRSLTAALEAVHDPDSPRDGVTGVPVLIDAGDVEDGLVMVHRVMSANPELEAAGVATVEPQTKVRLTLTSWAGNKLAERMLKNREELGNPPLDKDTAPGLAVPKLERALLDPETGAAQALYESGTWDLGEVDPNRAGVSLVEPLLDESGNRIGEVRLHRANYTAEDASFSGKNRGPIAWHNKLDITFFSDDVSPEDVAAALGRYGVADPRPASPEALKVIKENKMIALLVNKADGAYNFAGEPREEHLRKIKEEYDLTADDIEVQEVPGSGHIQYIAPEEFGKRIQAITNTTLLTHTSSQMDDTSPEEQARLVLRVLAGDDALLANVERRSVGKNRAGMSNGSDVLRQGGNYMFFTPTTTSPEPGTTTDVMGQQYQLDAAQVFRRLDWYYNSDDSFGARYPDYSPIEYLRSVGGSNGELMLKHTIDLPSAVVAMRWVHEDAAKDIIEWFHINRGGKLPSGRPIESLFGLPTPVETQEETL